uniref:NADH-ubiquinone oxidoreductase chain 1 n=1 Tax=Figites sp. ZJUH 20220009 TaxID=2995276 RepID=A0A9E8G6Z5_9HYME|nr:NADH dehydrogenase subunit 1 [Figites sp. ZJUH 20220009]
MLFMMYLTSIIINMLLIMMPLMSLAFLTLLERKLLSYIQIRKGPNKPSIMGILQPFSDAIKLFNKELFITKNSNFIYYLISPMISMTIMLMLWLIMPFYFNNFYNDLNILLFLCFLSMGVYPMMISGWSSNSMYSMLGSIRSISQTISYEVSLILIIMNSLILIENFNMSSLMYYQNYLNFMIYLYPIMLMFIISLTAELNRSPFDLSEGESELVSGFNTEYMSGNFALIFMSEYGMIMLMSLLFNLFYWSNYYYKFILYIKTMIIMSLFILFRGSFPRYRYDKLMMLTWKSFLPIIMNYILFIYMMKMLIMMFL